MTIEEEIHDAIYKELVLSYTQSGRVIPTTLAVVSKSLTESLKFSNVEEVHEAFRRARDMADIPTQRVLKEALTNHRAENYGAIAQDERKVIAYRDPRKAWLPKNPVMRAINRMEAVKNYCIACGNRAYWQLCQAKGNGDESYGAFVAQVMAVVARLYSKYWRSCPIANGYPANAEVTLELIPASVEDFRNMFAMESAGHV